jgi:deoxyribodipyrimidine photo-lyase
MIPAYIQPNRIQLLNDQEPVNGDYVLYWMQASQRTAYNHALDYAICEANDLHLPVVVGFGLTDNYPEANLRHYTFMLQGLCDVAAELQHRGIQFVLRQGDPADVALTLGRKAAMIVCDRGYLRHQKQWRTQVAENARRRVVQVESDVVVPANTVTDKREYAARTIRPKIHRALDRYLVPSPDLKPETFSNGVTVDTGLSHDPKKLLSRLSVDRSVPEVTPHFKGGTKAAQERLAHFMTRILPGYEQDRNEPHLGASSTLSPYLHFGQISPLQIVLAAKEAAAENPASVDAFIEELLVRRELSINFVLFSPNYDSYETLPDWTKLTLEAHAGDLRPHVYSEEKLEAANTHDPYWNAAMNEMRITGYMHNYMRMYWGKKILQWRRSPEQAYRTLLKLNNKYFLDGRDPNSYSGAAWIFGLHDRPWKERSIFGKVRYMAAGGLERKFKIGKYVEKIAGLA